MVIAVSDIKHAMLFSAKLTKDPSLELQIRANNFVVVINQTEKELSMTPSDELASFGKGNFKMVKKGEEPPAQSYPFCLKNDQDLLVVNGVVTTVGRAVIAQRKQKPDAQVRYHKCTVDETNVEKMTFEQTHNVVFVCGEAASETSKANIASKLGLDKWAQAKSARILWHCKWGQTVKGAEILPSTTCCLRCDRCCPWQLRSHRNAGWNW